MDPLAQTTNGTARMANAISSATIGGRPHGTSDFLCTKDQLIKILRSWEVDETLPTRNDSRVIVWPTSADVECECAKAEWTDTRSDYGKRLYRLTMGSTIHVIGMPVTPDEGVAR